MRLINIHTLELKEFIEGQQPQYVILSHRWTNDEISYKDFVKGRRAGSAGYLKIQRFCETVQTSPYLTCLACTQASRCFAHDSHEPVEWVWVDTACIDKRSSAELSEAINSMWKWYEAAECCIAYLADVHTSISDGMERFSENFAASDWFNRGWTLQELLAPEEVIFYNDSWTQIGRKGDQFVTAIISQITGIESIYFLYKGAMESECIARKLSWASKRQTTRGEDMSYCLLGLLNVNMSLLYGEGAERAFRRLQLKLIAQSDDESIFAWTTPTGQLPGLYPFLAPHPEYFVNSANIALPVDGHTVRAPYGITNKGIQFEGLAMELDFDSDQHKFDSNQMELEEIDIGVQHHVEGINLVESEVYYVMPLNCCDRSNPNPDALCEIVLSCFHPSEQTPTAFRIMQTRTHCPIKSLGFTSKNLRFSTRKFLLRID